MEERAVSPRKKNSKKKKNKTSSSPKKKPSSTRTSQGSTRALAASSGEALLLFDVQQLHRQEDSTSCITELAWDPTSSSASFSLRTSEAFESISLKLIWKPADVIAYPRTPCTLALAPSLPPNIESFREGINEILSELNSSRSTGPLRSMFRRLCEAFFVPFPFSSDLGVDGRAELTSSSESESPTPSREAVASESVQKQVEHDITELRNMFPGISIMASFPPNFISFRFVVPLWTIDISRDLAHAWRLHPSLPIALSLDFDREYVTSTSPPTVVSVTQSTTNDASSAFLDWMVAKQISSELFASASWPPKLEKTPSSSFSFSSDSARADFDALVAEFSSPFSQTYHDEPIPPRVVYLALLASPKQDKQKARTLLLDRKRRSQLIVHVTQKSHDEGQLAKLEKFNFLARIVYYVESRALKSCMSHCLICRKDLEYSVVKPVVCDNQLCIYRHEELGLGVSVLEEVLEQPDVVDLLISFTAASVLGGRISWKFPSSVWVRVPPKKPGDKEKVMSFMSGEEADDTKIRETFTKKDGLLAKLSSTHTSQFTSKMQNRQPDINKLTQVLEQMPSLFEMLDQFAVAKEEDEEEETPVKIAPAVDAYGAPVVVQTSSGRPVATGRHKRKPGKTEKDFKKWLDDINPLLYPLLRWIIAGNRAHLRRLRSKEMLGQIPTRHQFMLLTSPPEREKQFQKMKKEKGSYHMFHGSPIFNWFTILAMGLQYSGKDGLGRSGQGIWCANDFSTSVGYTGGGYAVGDVVNAWKKSMYGSTLFCMAILEVIKDGSGGAVPGQTVNVLTNTNLITTRYFLVFQKMVTSSAAKASELFTATGAPNSSASPAPNYDPDEMSVGSDPDEYYD